MSNPFEVARDLIKRYGFNQKTWSSSTETGFCLEAALFAATGQMQSVRGHRTLDPSNVVPGVSYDRKMTGISTPEYRFLANYLRQHERWDSEPFTWSDSHNEFEVVELLTQVAKAWDLRGKEETATADTTPPQYVHEILNAPTYSEALNMGYAEFMAMRDLEYISTY